MLGREERLPTVKMVKEFMIFLDMEPYEWQIEFLEKWIAPAHMSIQK